VRTETRWFQEGSVETRQAKVKGRKSEDTALANLQIKASRKESRRTSGGTKDKKGDGQETSQRDLEGTPG